MEVICVDTKKTYKAYAKAEFVHREDDDQVREIAYLIRHPHNLGGAANLGELKHIYHVSLLYSSPDINLNLSNLNEFEWVDEPHYVDCTSFTNKDATILLNKNKHYG